MKPDELAATLEVLVRDVIKAASQWKVDETSGIDPYDVIDGDTRVAVAVDAILRQSGQLP